jgi:hypothetical protein
VTVVHFFSTLDLSGPRTRKPPTSWEPLMPEEAVERLAQALSLPGVVSCTPGWIAAQDRDRDATRLSRPWLSLPSLMDSNRETVWDLARRIAKGKWGVILCEEFVPPKSVSVYDVVEVIEQATRVWRRMCNNSDASGGTTSPSSRPS